MARPPLPPLHPKVAAQLRATFAEPPVGAKRRVRGRLELAGIIGALPYDDAGLIATSRAPESSGISPHSTRRTVARSRRVGRAAVVAKAVPVLLAGVAMGTAAVFFSAGRGPASAPAPYVGQEEVLRSLPSALRETVRVGKLDPGPAPAPPIAPAAPRSEALNLKRPSDAETLGREQKLLGRARAALGRTDLESAMQELDRHARLFPNGALNEERDALRIITLALQGNLALARERAVRFRHAYPRSIQMTAIDGAIGERP